MNNLPTNFLEEMWATEAAMTEDEKAIRDMKEELKAEALENNRLEKNALVSVSKCHKCNGSGLFVRNSFAYGTVVGSRHGSNCFACKGTGSKKGATAAKDALALTHLAVVAAFAV